MVGAVCRTAAPLYLSVILIRLLLLTMTYGWMADTNSNDILQLSKRKNLCALHPELFVCTAYEDADLLAEPAFQRDDKSSGQLPNDFPRPTDLPLPLRLRMNVSRTGDIRQPLTEDETLFEDSELRARRLELLRELERIETTEVQLKSPSQQKSLLDGLTTDRSLFEPDYPPFSIQSHSVHPDRTLSERDRTAEVVESNPSEPFEVPLRPIRPVKTDAIGFNSPNDPNALTRSVIEGYSNSPTTTVVENELPPYYQPAAAVPGYYSGYGDGGGGYYGYDNFQPRRNLYGSPYSANGGATPYGGYYGGYGGYGGRPAGYGSTRNMIGELFGFGTGINLAIPMLGVDLNTGIGIAAG